ncbi:hypothetical protein Moror_11987 [Moniliophthora roreri MCA 2997]|uniref:Uncharacterized protein n=2 Tax=Moniliophthora roreri TaxID=221103 RepID=V2WZL9_MONRO|nr:hypothetical protein Moror_11987 [Moniliophthora roreri MCA 2997]
MPTNVGIALYTQTDSRGRKTNPHWALVAHETDYLLPNVRVFQIGLDHSDSWILKPKTCSLANSSSLIGIVHVAQIPKDISWLEDFSKQFPAVKNGDNPSGLLGWSCEAWVIRFLWALVDARMISLPCDVTQVYDYVRAKKVTMEGCRAQVPHIIPVVSLVTDELQRQMQTDIHSQ